jgi:hypothetical protein
MLVFRVIFIYTTLIAMRVINCKARLTQTSPMTETGYRAIDRCELPTKALAMPDHTFGMSRVVHTHRKRGHNLGLLSCSIIDADQEFACPSA